MGLFVPGTLPGVVGQERKTQRAPATQRLAEGRAADGDLPYPLGWPELAWPLLRGGAVWRDGGVRFPTDPGFWCGCGSQINTSVEGAFLRPAGGEKGPALRQDPGTRFRPPTY